MPGSRSRTMILCRLMGNEGSSRREAEESSQGFLKLVLPYFYIACFKLSFHIILFGSVYFHPERIICTVLALKRRMSEISIDKVMYLSAY